MGFRLRWILWFASGCFRLWRSRSADATLKVCAAFTSWVRGPGSTPWTAHVSGRLAAAVALLAASVTAGSALAFVVGDHGSRPSAIGRLNVDTPTGCAEAFDPEVAEPAPAPTSIAVEPPFDIPRATAPATTAPDDPTTTATAPVDPQPRVPERVLYVGDSIAWQTSGALKKLLPDTQVDTLVYGGTAPCDWVSAVTNYPHDADVVLFSFMGNNVTEATGHATGEALLTQYRDELRAMCAELAPARCVAVGQPVPGPDVERTFGVEGEPTAMYQHEGQNGSWEFVDAGAAVETADGGFDPSVREADGVHLNAVGVERFATAIAHYLLDN